MISETIYKVCRDGQHSVTTVFSFKSTAPINVVKGITETMDLDRTKDYENALINKLRKKGYKAQLIKYEYIWV